MKKVVLIIAEGASEEGALYPFLKELGKPHNILFKITRGDILSDYKNAKTSHKNIVGDVVRQYMKERRFLKENILCVIQLTDTDGVFIDDSKVIINESMESIRYTEEFIEVNNQNQVKQIVKRNNLKSDKIKALVRTPFTLTNIPYKIYYFSCNLDHVLHGNQNIGNSEKVDLADDFADSLTKSEITKFFEQQAIHNTEDYKESWNFIFDANNSLKKSSNFILFLKELIKLTEKI